MPFPRNAGSSCSGPVRFNRAAQVTLAAPYYEKAFRRRAEPGRMKKTLFQVTVKSFETVRELDGAWTYEKCRTALQTLDYVGADEIPEEEGSTHDVLRILERDRVIRHVNSRL